MMMMAMLVMSAATAPTIYGLSPGDKSWKEFSLKNIKTILGDLDVIEMANNDGNVSLLKKCGVLLSKDAHDAYEESLRIKVDDPNVKKAKIAWESAMYLFYQAGVSLSKGEYKLFDDYLNRGTNYLEIWRDYY